MAKKANFRSNFGLFLQNLISKIFFCGFYLYQMLYIVISYHCMQFQGKLVKQSWENHKKNASSELDLVDFRGFYLYYM